MKTPWLWLFGLLFLVASPVEADIKILVLGDSLTAGYGLPLEQAFPAQLETALCQRGHSVQVVNAGISGDTSAGGAARLAWSLSDRPDIVIIELGANDALRGLSPQQTEANLAAIIEQVEQENMIALLTGMKAPRNLGATYYNSFDGLYPALAQQFDVAFYPFFLDGVAGVPELNQSDGIHPSPKGVKVIVEGILPLVESLL